MVILYKTKPYYFAMYDNNLENIEVETVENVCIIYMQNQLSVTNILQNN
jgi:hypothetical protein